MKINLELRGGNESGFILRYDPNVANSPQENKKFVFIIESFHLSVLRLRPAERLRTQLHKILQKPIKHPILNMTPHEKILIR